eukprot:5102899-Amphidinium_carterae.1
MLIIVAKDSKTGTLASTSLPAKGIGDYATKWLVGLIKRLGYRRLILQSDGEHSIKALKDSCLPLLKGIEIIMREPPPGEHQSNGEAEVAVREVKRQIR